MEKKTIYIGFDALLTLSQVLKADHISPEEYDALKNIWKLYDEEKIRLVTSGEDMKMDIIMWLNDHGCCVTDTLTPLEALKEFERWERADKNMAKKWRRVFYYYDRIEFLSKNYDDTSTMIKTLSEEFPGLKVHDDPNCYNYDLTTVKNILKECANTFGEIYSQEKWQDLSSIDYSLNWSVFERAMKKLGIELELHGLYGNANKKIFGLLNRLINLSKKSSKKPQLAPEHINFLLNTVINKYYIQRTNYINHILHCISHSIEYLVDTDKKFIECFRNRREELMGKFKFFQKKFNLLTPYELQSELSEK